MLSADLEREDEPVAAGRRLPVSLGKFWIRSIAAFILMFLIVFLKHINGLPGAHYSPLVDPIFGDLLEYIPTFQRVHTTAFFDSATLAFPAVAYPPFGALIFAFLYTVSRPVVLYVAIAALFMGTCVWGVRRALMQQGISSLVATLFPLTILIVSFPAEGLMQRGNIELFLWIFTAAGAWAFLRDQDDAAAILWAFAAAAKIYPIIFLVLLLPRKKYRSFLIGVAAFIVISLISMEYFGPSISVVFHGSLHNVFGYQGARVAEFTDHDLGANHSFFSLVKIAAVLAKIPSSGLTLPYYACGALVFAAIFFGRVRKMPVANQLLMVSAFMVMLPPISYFYTLVHLYAAWLVLVFLAIRAGRAGVEIRGLSTTILLFVPIFASYSLFTYRGIHIWGGPVQALFLVWLFVCAVWFPFEMPVYEDASASTI